MSIRPFVMPFRLSCAYLIYDADAALPHLNPRKRRRGGIFIYEKRDHCIISCNSLFIFLINANLLTLATWATRWALGGALSKLENRSYSGAGLPRASPYKIAGYGIANSRLAFSVVARATSAASMPRRAAISSAT